MIGCRPIEARLPRFRNSVPQRRKSDLALAQTRLGEFRHLGQISCTLLLRKVQPPFPGDMAHRANNGAAALAEIATWPGVLSANMVFEQVERLAEIGD